MTLQEELELQLKELENVPPLPPEEQVLIDLIAGIWAEKADKILKEGNNE